MTKQKIVTVEGFLGSGTDFRVKMPSQRTTGKTEFYVSKEELRKSRRWVSEVLRSFLELFITYRLETGIASKSASEERVRKSDGWLRRVKVCPFAEQTVPSRAGIKQADIPVGLWVAAILIFGLGDSLTSALAFRTGGYEGNSLIGLLGGSLWAFVVVKTGVLAGLFFLSYYMLPRHGWLVPALLCAVGLYLVVSNLIAVFTII